MSNQNFYQDLDLRYIEIGYNMAVIDRCNPGFVPFNIPVLTPQMDNTSMKDTTVIQRDKSNIQNASVGSVEVSDLEMSNYIYITVPRELCTHPDGWYDIEGTVSLSGHTTMSNGSMNMTNGFISHNETFDNITIRGTVSEEAGYVGGSGSANGTITFSGNHNYSASHNYSTIDSHIDGRIKITPVDRYIPIGKKWAICFLGGDVNMPVVIARLPD